MGGPMGPGIVPALAQIQTAHAGSSGAASLGSSSWPMPSFVRGSAGASVLLCVWACICASCMCVYERVCVCVRLCVYARAALVHAPRLKNSNRCLRRSTGINCSQIVACIPAHSILIPLA